MNEGNVFYVDTLSFPSEHSARTLTNPPGASKVISVIGSIIGIKPVSNKTVATQILLEPDIGGLSITDSAKNIEAQLLKFKCC